MFFVENQIHHYKKALLFFYNIIKNGLVKKDFYRFGA